MLPLTAHKNFDEELACEMQRLSKQDNFSERGRKPSSIAAERKSTTTRRVLSVETVCIAAAECESTYSHNRVDYLGWIQDNAWHSTKPYRRQHNGVWQQLTCLHGLGLSAFSWKKTFQKAPLAHLPFSSSCKQLANSHLRLCGVQRN